jgi:hypothetical protein
VSLVWDVHTLPGAGPVRHYLAYPDEASGRRAAAHLVDVLGEPLVAESVDDVVWLDRLLGREPGGTDPGGVSR